MVLEIKRFVSQNMCALLRSEHTWIFQICKISAFSPQKHTKRQKFYILGRSRYIYIYSKAFSKYLKTLQGVQLQSQAASFGRDSKSFDKNWTNTHFFSVIVSCFVKYYPPATSSHRLKHVETNHFTIFVGFLGKEGLEVLYCFPFYWVHAPFKSQSESCYLLNWNHPPLIGD